ncbi:MAG: oligosaccharide flippase family protein [Pseudomonadota bacterium]
MLFFFLPRMLSALATILILVVLTRVLTPADFGKYSMTLLIGYVGFAFTFAWLSASIPRFHHAERYGGRATASILVIAAVLACLLIPLVALAFAVPWPAATLFVLGAAYSLGHATHELGLSGLRVLKAGPQYAAATLLRPTLAVALALAFVQNGWGYEGAVWGFVIGATTTGTISLLYVIRQTGLSKPDREMITAFLVYGKPLAVVTSMSSFFLLASQSLLGALESLEAVGYFAAAQTLAMRSIRMPMSNLSAVAAASVFKAQETASVDAVDGQMRRHFSFLILFVLPIALVLFCANHTIAALFFDSEFQTETAQNLRLLAVAALLLGLQGAYFSYAFTLSRRTSLQLGVTLATLATHVLVSWGCIVVFGPLGASVGFVVSAILSISVFHLVGRKIHKSLLPVQEIGKALIGVCVLAPIALYTNQINSLPVAITVLVLGVLAFWIVLMLAQQTAAQAVLSNLKRRLRKSPAAN